MITIDTLYNKRKELMQEHDEMMSHVNAIIGAIQLVDELIAGEMKLSGNASVSSNDSSSNASTSDEKRANLRVIK